jgi:hypothetical protein
LHAYDKTLKENAQNLASFTHRACGAQGTEDCVNTAEAAGSLCLQCIHVDNHLHQQQQQQQQWAAV